MGPAGGSCHLQQKLLEMGVGPRPGEWEGTGPRNVMAYPVQKAPPTCPL